MTSHRRRARPSWVLWSLLSLACASPSQQRAGGLFWAGDTDGGPWLIYLGQGVESSALHQPHHVLGVCNLRVLGGGEVSFRTASEKDGIAYRFVGHWSAAGLTGRMNRMQHQTGMEVDTQQLELRWIAATLPSDGRSISGDYTEGRPNIGSGDSAAELVLVDAPHGLVGILRDYDGGQADIRAVTGERDGGVLRFALQSATRREVETASLRGDTLVLHGGRLRLVRRSTLPVLFHDPNRKGCDEAPR